MVPSLCSRGMPSGGGQESDNGEHDGKILLNGVESAEHNNGRVRSVCLLALREAL